ncbi:unnamed protein product [Hyaloperonospora brassicae]|uniref:BAR domain-containing protein n=1 Tax=Hyaloperonospora brassicae TaxID=162125 RepID=A0AAV0TH63_HYABA|nr:unnamed protein product [Hyaloperonospora brassicae]
MSSLRVRTKNKLMMALGLVTPSTNVAFDLVYSDFEPTLERLATLDSVLRTYLYSIKRFHGAASPVMVALDDLSSGDNRSTGYRQSSTGSFEVKKFAGEARVACATMDRTVLQETCDRLELEVLVPVTKWLQHARNLESKALAFRRQKTLYDHYSRKVVALREAHEKRVGSGRSERTKATERMFRNKQKLVATTQMYTQLSETIVRELRAFAVARDATLAPLLYRVLHGRIVYAKRMNEAAHCIRALVEENLEKSEQCGIVGGLSVDTRGGEYLKSQVNVVTAATTPVSAKAMVHESPFRTFVSGSSSQAATHVNTLKSACNDAGRACASPSASWSKRKMQVPFRMRQSAYLPSKLGYTPPHGVPHVTNGSVTTNTAAATRSYGNDCSVSAVSTAPAETSSSVSRSLPSVATTGFWNIFSGASAPSDGL